VRPSHPGYLLAGALRAEASCPTVCAVRSAQVAGYGTERGDLPYQGRLAWEPPWMKKIMLMTFAGESVQVRRRTNSARSTSRADHRCPVSAASARLYSSSIMYRA
jgi:hypothetical protein